jgi:predicted dehydrogenase
MAAALDNSAMMVAGALSSTPERARESGRMLGLDDARNYGTWREMLEGELKRPHAASFDSPEGRIDLVTIVTPNDQHFEPARAFALAGFNVVCDKPLCHTSTQAADLEGIVRKTGVVFCVTYNYSGYPLVKEARSLVKAGRLGAIRKVLVEYNQGWLATRLEQSGHKQAAWRTDPARSGAGGAIGDIGTHAEQLVSYITGLELGSISADLTAFVPGRPLDDDANILLRFKERDGVAAKGMLTASQVCIGCENDLRIRVWGTKGGIEWRQEDPNSLTLKTLRADGGVDESLLRRGGIQLSPAAASGTRLPPGHPEAFIEAFANVYRNTIAAMRARAAGKPCGPDAFDYPGVTDGARGVRFIERAVAGR